MTHPSKHSKTTERWESRSTLIFTTKLRSLITLKGWPALRQAKKSTGSTAPETTPQETFAGPLERRTAETCVEQSGLYTTANGWPLKSSLSDLLTNSSRKLLLGLLNAASPVRRSWRGNPSAPVPVFDIVNAGPRHRFCTANFVAHNCLGLGYGCGWHKFVTFARQMLPEKTYNAVFGAPVSANEIRLFMTSLGKRMRDGKELTAKFQALPPQEKAYWVNSAKQVEAYRKSNPKVTELWALLEKLMERACGNKEFSLELPSGRVLSYKAPKNHGGLSAETPRLGRMMRVKYHGGILTENCLAGDTEVLTPRGWIPLREVNTSDTVWDGEEFVPHEGLVYKGQHPTVSVGGVRATADHKFLSMDGVSWVDAACINHLRELKSLHHDGSDRPHRLHICKPNGVSSVRNKRAQEIVACAVRLRRPSHVPCLRASRGETGLLSKTVSPVPGEPAEPSHNPRYVPTPGVRGVEQYVGSVQAPVAQSLQKLRRAWDKCRARMEAVPQFLARHGAVLPPRLRLGSDKQQPRLLCRELSLDYPQSELRQQAEQLDRSVGVARKLEGIRRREWGPPLHARLSATKGLDVGAGAKHAGQRNEQVYDLVNCGPRHRFAVRGGPGLPVFIAHNCTQGVARDVFADCVLRLEAAGYSLILHAHDEAVCLVDEATAEADCAAIEKIMSTPPEWMPTLPQAAEAHVCSLYTK